jgi:divalent metal cation (Fe/Co/Zn/Cd) transporter
MLGAAVYVLVQAVRALLAGSESSTAAVALVLLGISVFVLPTLGLLKLRLAGILGSTALRGDGVLSAAGAALALIALVGAGAEAWWGWWWSNPTAALAIAAFLIREGAKTLRGSHDKTDATSAVSVVVQG